MQKNKKQNADLGNDYFESPKNEFNKKLPGIKVRNSLSSPSRTTKSRSVKHGQSSPLKGKDIFKDVDD